MKIIEKMRATDCIEVGKMEHPFLELFTQCCES